MDGRAEQPEEFASAFEAAFARLQVLLETACVGGGTWPERVGIAVQRTLDFAVAEPDDARVLTAGALANDVDGVERYERLMAYVAGLLESGRAESPNGPGLPETTERSLAGGVATIVANRVERDRGAELSGLTAEVVQFVLTPYFGTPEAKRLAEAGDWPDGQSAR